MTPMMHAVIAALTGKRIALEHEKQTQNLIWLALNFARSDGRIRAAATIRREVAMPAGVIDFTVDDVGVEVKIKGQSLAIMRQIERYAADSTLNGIVLVTSRPIALPDLIHGKPVAVFDLARAWL